jgi:hypothetical protein
VQRLVQQAVGAPTYGAPMPKEFRGHIQRLPSGSYRVHVYVGIDPITRREIRLYATAKDETQAQIELGRFLQEARDGRTPETGVTGSRGCWAVVIARKTTVAEGWLAQPRERIGLPARFALPRCAGRRSRRA